MKVAMIGSRGIGSNYGGIERVIDELCPRLVALGHEVDVFSSLREPLPLPAGLRSIFVPALGGKHFENLSRSALSTLMAMGKYDVLHFHATGPGLLSALTKVVRQKSIVTIHALDQNREKWNGPAKAALQLAERSVMTFADEVTVVSEGLRRYLRERYDRLALHIPNGLPAKEKVSPGELLARHNLEPGKYFLFASRLTPEKGCHDLIDAFNRVDTDVKLAIAGGVGPSDYLSQLKEKADKKRIVFLGHLEGKELGEAFSNARTFILPSYIEGMSMALLEAIAYRLPVLVSDIDENIDVVGSHGRRFRKGDVADLANHLSELAAPSECDVQNGNEPLFLSGWDDIAKSYDHLYSRVARRYRPQNEMAVG